MSNIIITAIICATVLAGIVLLQRYGVPTLSIKFETVHPVIEYTPIDALPDIEELTPKEKKEQAFADPAAVINAFLEGGIDLGI